MAQPGPKERGGARLSPRGWVTDVGRDDQRLQQHLAVERLKILEVIEQALRRYAEIMPALWECADREEALAVIQDLLDVDAVRAQAVLDLQWSRSIRDQRVILAQERARVRAVVELGLPMDSDR